MDTQRYDGSIPIRSSGVSRREVLLRAGAGGLAVALAVQGIEAATAQEATPAMGDATPAANELVVAEPLAAIPLEQLPPGPVTLELTRITLLPGFSSPPDAHGVLEIAHVESGTIVVPPNAPDGAYNNGTVPAVVLFIHIGPQEGEATPAATPAM